MDNELRREIIMDNYQYPYNREVPSNLEEYIKVNSNNESCIDNIDIYIKIENDKIVDIKFMGEACAISTSATSVMIKLLIGKTLDEVRSLYKEYSDMIENGTSYDNLEEANAYGQIYKQQNRKHCAMLHWLGIIKALEDKNLRI